MEFAIDFARIRKITAQEYDQARKEIAELGVIVAYQQSRARHDERLASAPDTTTLACKAGCSWCCHFSVDIRAVEAFSILAFIEQHLSAQEQARVREEIAANYVILKNLSDLERVQRNLKCAFLNEGRCTIYAARPQTCRNYHATDAAGCQKSFEEPDNLDIDPDFAPLVYQVGGAHVDAFSKAVEDAGYDVAAYELNAALMAVMANSEESQRRFVAKQRPFDALNGIEVPPEFMELEE
jgi:Fe-S-cluster containining protein